MRSSRIVSRWKFLTSSSRTSMIDLHKVDCSKASLQHSIVWEIERKTKCNKRQCHAIKIPLEYKTWPHFFLTLDSIECYRNHSASRYKHTRIFVSKRSFVLCQRFYFSVSYKYPQGNSSYLKSGLSIHQWATAPVPRVCKT